MTARRQPLEVLASNGFPVEQLTPEQREVLDGLTAAEVDLLIGIKSRLDEVGPDVVAHSEIAGAALF
ncbi:aroma-sacti cluster domain-containing protein [Plantactinospora sp. WMMB334]|uniref:aroma-sacti cluster domain-containing protein n=1 Tax=Plantactinospora sp. WMMB334 TaxID=3404119 RepID=UPI003B94731A